MSNTPNLWDEDRYHYNVGATYILNCEDADMAIDDTLDANRLRWVKGEGYKLWTPHALNYLAREYIKNDCDRHTVDAVTVAFWGCTMQEAITLIGQGESDA